jgi:hypothetical protein
MRVIIFSLIYAAFSFVLMVDQGLAADKAIPICNISRAYFGGFMCIEGVPYFMGEHKRRDEEKLTAWPWKKNVVYCIYFELTSLEGTTTIYNLGPGDLSDVNSKFVSEKTPGDDKSKPGYLTADYSTDPPSVRIEKKPGKFSTWKVHRIEENKYWIENVSDSGKSASLSMAEKPEVLSPAASGGTVVEYQRAVLSFDGKAVFKITQQNDDR